MTAEQKSDGLTARVALNRWDVLGFELEDSKECPPAQKMPNRSLRGNAIDIVTWQYCHLCRSEVTPRTYLSSSVGRLSFPQFLGLLLTSGDMVYSSSLAGATGIGGRRVDENQTIVSQQCPHKAFFSRSFFFARGTTVVNFEVSPIEVYPLRQQPRNFLSQDVPTVLLKKYHQRMRASAAAGQVQGNQKKKNPPIMESKPPAPSSDSARIVSQAFLWALPVLSPAQKLEAHRFLRSLDAGGDLPSILRGREHLDIFSVRPTRGEAEGEGVVLQMLLKRFP